MFGCIIIYLYYYLNKRKPLLFSKLTTLYNTIFHVKSLFIYSFTLIYCNIKENLYFPFLFCLSIQNKSLNYFNGAF